MKIEWNFYNFFSIPINLQNRSVAIKFGFSLQQDQDKMSAQQKSMKEAEQEKQWKQLQAMRAREQQMGLTNDQRMHHNMNGESIMKLYYFLHILNFFPFQIQMCNYKSQRA